MEIKIIKIKSIIETEKIKHGDIFEVIISQPNGDVYFLDKTNTVRRLHPNEYTIIKVINVE